MKKINKCLFVILILLLNSCNNIPSNQLDDPKIDSWTINKNNDVDKVNSQTWEENINKDNIDNNWNSLWYNWVDNTWLWLKVSDGFTISIFADWLDWARDLVWPDNLWNYYLSRTKNWVITMLIMKDWTIDQKVDIIKNLNNPHWLALNNSGSILYYAETDKLSKIYLYSDAKPEKIIDLPEWWRHYTRSLSWWSDWKLYISIWSTCDVCYEKDNRIGKIFSINEDWSNFEEVSSWLRNSVFMDINPITWELRATEMWRDNLWDNIPPDEINIIKKWNDYWWPICYWNNIHDWDFDKNVYIMNPCINKTPAFIELQAHSAPLWLNFIPEEWWPENYYNDLLVSYHWSWNRSEKTGYKLVHITLDDKWNYVSKRDFITWWLDDNSNVSWRVVDILNFPWWISYVTDDKKWVIYKITYENK